MRSNRALGKAQAALEYLTTYSWAIVVLAMVIGVLFAYGIFNPNFLTPKAPPGSCYVNRPYGPHSTSLISLAGVCNGEMPRYVATFIGAGNVNTNTLVILSSSTALSYTISLWVNPSSVAVGQYIISSTPDVGIEDCEVSNNPYQFCLAFGDGTHPQIHLGLFGGGSTWTPPAGSGIPLNTWSHVVVTFTEIPATFGATHPGTMVANVLVNDASTPLTVSENYFGAIYPLVIGGASGGNADNFNGVIANVQVYNTTLTQNDITSLYMEGMGGAPIDLQNIIGWFPLNGNTQDYSGNNVTAAPSNILISTLISNYTLP